MAERTYTAALDNGFHYNDFEYQSEHRAGSKANFDDMMRQYRRKYGNSAVAAIERHNTPKSVRPEIRRY